ncbi:hypothetical protein ALC57_13231 [Trachymyrmex cornetzi]|nr:hypothetical protein ALC57_13231 [Trachymyrmex cornetzi]
MTSLLETYSAVQLQETFLFMLRRNGRKEVANAIEYMLNADSDDIESCLRSYLKIQEQVPYSNEEIVAFAEDTDLTKHQYTILRKQALAKNVIIYPSYRQLVNAREACIPSDIHVSDVCAKVNLQSLVDHTISRILITENLPVDTLNNSDKFRLLVK